MLTLVFNFRSQFFQSLRFFSSQPKERSTTHLFGSTTKEWSSFLFTTSTDAWIISFTCVANFSPRYPPSTNTFSTKERSGLFSSNILMAPSRSETFAVVTVIACGNPCVSTVIWRLIPETFFPASYPFSFAVSVFFTLFASTIAKLVVSFRPSLIRASPTDFF